MQKTVTICLVLVGLINLVPVLGVFAAANIESAYAVHIADQNLVILMRHRALLFGVLGSFIIFSAFVARYQLAAMIMAAASMGGFIVLAMATPGYSEALARIAQFDAIGLVLLLVAALLKFAARGA